MIVASRRKSLQLAYRAFHVSQTHSIIDTNKTARVTSQKAYAKLPDCSSITPLQDWDGGLELKRNPERGTKTISHDYAREDKPSNKISKTPRKRSKVKLSPLTTEGSTSDVPAIRVSTKTKSRAEIKSELSTLEQCRSPFSHGTEMQTRPQNQLAREILDNLFKFPHCILLTRVGSFYESYFEQASEVAHLLSIKLTKRTWDKQEVLMCGFPIIHLDKYLKVLVRQHKRLVALCEEFKRNPPEEGFERRVVRILTPGTLTEESVLDPHENNYLLAVNDTSNLSSSSEYVIGLAWIDVSTGELFTQRSRLEQFKDELARISPREVVLPCEVKHHSNNLVYQAAVAGDFFISFCAQRQGNPCYFATPATDDILDFTDADSSLSIHETSAVSLLTSFLRDHLLEHMPPLSCPARRNDLHRMHIDSHTLKSLEVREGIREGGTTGSLLNVIKRTVTNSGTRLLTRWLCSPSTSISEIKNRQSLVSFFAERPHLRHDIVQHLRRLEDTYRTVQRFLLKKGDVYDLLTIKETIDLWKTIKLRIETEYSEESAKEQHTTLRHLLHNISDLATLATRIELAVESRVGCSNNSPASEITGLDDINEGLSQYVYPSGQIKPTIRASFSPRLVSLHKQLSNSQAAQLRLEMQFQERFAAPSLTLRLSGKIGVHVHLSKPIRDAEKIERDSQFVLLSSSASSRMFFNQEWHILGSKIIDINTQILGAEKDAFDVLRNEVKTHVLYLRKNARIMDELDVIIGFAQLAEDLKFVKPTLDESTNYDVVNGRHPSVEIGLLGSGRVFTPNTVSLSSTSRAHIITGPNMAGKSTLLRQTAVITILAQIGSFVPADRATIGIVDRLFSRIGAKDDLFRDRSTFMVEMTETADILKNATDRSLVIMDEVGRGTTVQDGLAIAFATVYHLYRINRSRVLFATHFHELADMLGYFEKQPKTESFSEIDFFCTDVHVTADGHFTYSHRLRPGVNRDSHGLKVAALAGIPSSALAVAEGTLRYMKGFKHSPSKESYAEAASNVISNFNDSL